MYTLATVILKITKLANSYIANYTYCYYYTKGNYYTLANDYCYNEQLAGGEDLYPFVISITNVYVTIRGKSYSTRILEFTIIRSI